MGSIRNYSVVFVYNVETHKMLQCRRNGESESTCDLIGGERLPGESGIECAYRRLNTETGMDEGDITLQRILDFSHVLDQRRLQVFAGAMSLDENSLKEGKAFKWADIDGDLCSKHEFLTENCLNYIISALNYNPEIGLFEGSLKNR